MSVSVQEYIEEHVPNMPLSDICEIEASIESLGQDVNNPDISTLNDLIEDLGYTLDDDIPEEDFSHSDDEPSEDDF